MALPKIVKANERIVLFDGVCNLCSAFLSFVYERDKCGMFKFAWIQSEHGKEISKWLNMPTDNYVTMIYIEDRKPYLKSTAFLKIVKYLKLPWPVLSIGFIVPKFIRDWIYDRIAVNRYKLFGRKEQCLMPTGELRKRFLD
jgi:predicted DCC family thiol-disulfide oxidoreductase YuxK